MSLKNPPDITVFDIASWFLVKAKSENKPLTHMKLQKLVYYAYGWYCAYYDNPPLFADAIYAWRRGVVVKTLYEEYATFGENPIIPENMDCPNLDENVVEILKSVWKAYASYSNATLDRMIRRQSAWRVAQRSSAWEVILLPERIQQSFRLLMEKYENAEKE